MKLLIASLLLLSSPLYARITQSPNVSVTAAADDADNVAKQNGYLYYWDGSVNRRVMGDANGNIYVSNASGGAATSVTLSSVATGVSITVNNTNASAVPVRITGTTAVSDTGAYNNLSSPVITLTTAYMVNITSAAAASGPCEFCFSAIGVNNFWYGWGNSSTFPTSFGALYAVSTTPICKSNLYPGTHLYMSVTAAALTSTVQAWYSVKQQ